jgi:hypothetical protein
MGVALRTSESVDSSPFRPLSPTVDVGPAGSPQLSAKVGYSGRTPSLASQATVHYSLAIP